MNTIGGTRIGLAYGLAVASSSVLGLWSITVAPTTFLLIWFLDQVLELSVAGAIISAVKVSQSRRITRFVGIEVMALVFGGIALQNFLG